MFRQRDSRHQEREEGDTIWKEWPHFPITVPVLSPVTPEALMCKHTQCAIVARIFARGTCAVKLHATDTANIVFRHIPSPCRHSVPLLDRDLHPSIAKPSGGTEAGSRVMLLMEIKG